MRRFVLTLVLLSCIAAGVFYFQVLKPKQVAAALAEQQIYMGDSESGCFFPLSRVSDGKNPVWWSERQRDWNRFDSKSEALAAGYRQCAE